jgi:hypothetical protein
VIFQTLETNIYISQLITKNNGTPETNLTLFCFIFNANTGALEISGGAVTEIGSGFYSFTWTHGKTDNANYYWYFKDTNNINNAGNYFASGNFRIVTTKNDLTDTIDLADGQAV